MTQITVTFQDGEIKDRLTRLTAAVETLPKKAMKAEMQAALERARQYPPELPNQRYTRTGTYYRSFKLMPSAGRGYTLISDAQQKGRRYSKYVGGDAAGEGQAWFHIGRWPIIRDYVEDAMERLRQRAEQAFRDILAGGPGGL